MDVAQRPKAVGPCPRRTQGYPWFLHLGRGSFSWFFGLRVVLGGPPWTLDFREIGHKRLSQNPRGPSWTLAVHRSGVRVPSGVPATFTKQIAALPAVGRAVKNQLRVAVPKELLAPLPACLLERVRQSELVFGDETSIKMLGSTTPPIASMSCSPIAGPVRTSGPLGKTWRAKILSAVRQVAPDAPRLPGIELGLEAVVEPEFLDAISRRGGFRHVAMLTHGFFRSKVSVRPWTA